MLFSFIKLNHQTTTNRWWSPDFKHGIVRFTINQSFSLGVCVCKCEFLFHLLLLQRIYSSFIRFYPFIHRLMKHSRVSLFFLHRRVIFFLNLFIENQKIEYTPIRIISGYLVLFGYYEGPVSFV